MGVTAIIPVRYQSSRLPGKPLVDIAGQPMIQRVYTQVASADGVDRVVIATDDERIAQACQGFGGRVVMTGLEHNCGTERVGEAADRLGLAPDEIVVNVQGDQPLIPPQTVTEVAALLTADPALNISTLAVPMSREEAADPINVAVVLDDSGFALYFSRSVIPFDRDGDQPVVYLKHLGIYAYRRRFLDRFKAWGPGRLEEIEKLEMLRVLERGGRIKVGVTEHDSIEVDRPQDVVKVESVLAG